MHIIDEQQKENIFIGGGDLASEGVSNGQRSAVAPLNRGRTNKQVKKNGLVTNAKSLSPYKAYE